MTLAAVLALTLVTLTSASTVHSSAADTARARKQAATPTSVSAAVAQAISQSELTKAVVAVSVRDIASGKVIAECEGDRLMAPASNMKVLTTAAALRILGADFKFSTRLLRERDRLTVLADGDPSFGDPEILDEMTHTVNGVKRLGLTTEELIDIWVNAARVNGIKSVSELVVDDRIFDREFTHNCWPADQLSNSYCAEISGLNFHVNLLQASISVSGGKPSVTEWSPTAPWLEVDSSKATASAGKNAKQNIWIGRTDTPWGFSLNGNTKSALAEPIAVCVHDMPTFFARYVADRMRAGGIAVKSTRASVASDPASSGEPLGPPISSVLARVVQQCNTESQNLYAESLLKRIGAKRTGQSGSWSNGAAALAAEVDGCLGAGTAAKGLVVSDGSGLCRENRVTSHLLTGWLRAIALDPKSGGVFINSLAVAGVSGTVKKRFSTLDTDRVFVPCKTGYINGVSCLSGYVGRPGRAPQFTFSVLCNDLSKDPNGVGKAKALQERIVMILASALADEK